ncbi:MAG: hypothetical protein ACK5AZ_06140 [Bryobacteraceae bacterium]
MKLKDFLRFVASLAVLAQIVPAQVTLNPVASRAVGHARLKNPATNAPDSSAPNLVEGRELNTPQGIALDVGRGILYVADSGNNRVLGWRNPAAASNGAPADIIIGQRDRFGTSAQGPGVSGSTLSSGLNQPTGLAVDAAGNLYVADAANHRILRFPSPGDQSGELVLPDMVIGQKQISQGRQANQGSPAPNARTVHFTNNAGAAQVVGMAFDPSGNLYISDPGNHRVLRYKASDLASGQNEPAADLVLGQLSFETRTALGASPATNVLYKGGGQNPGPYMNTPAGLCLDDGGRLYVADALNRVLVFEPGFVSSTPARRLMGIVVQVAGEPPLPEVNQFRLRAPQGVFIMGNTPAVVDTFSHRIVQFPHYNQWPAESQTQISPAATGVIGQAVMTAGDANRGLPEPSAQSFHTPVAAVFANDQLYVADAFNHRVLIFSPPHQQAFRVLGQDGFLYRGANLLEGRELFLFGGFSSISGVSASFADGGGLVVDTRTDPPALFIADTFNHRILGYRDVRRVRPGDKADLVIGQGEGDGAMRRNQVNHPFNDSNNRTDRGLFLPTSLALDEHGNLYVADSGNGRVLRYPTPFAQPAGSEIRPNLVLGQMNFTFRITDATSSTMARPFGLAFTVEGHLLVSDAQHNRVLFFLRPPGGDFTNGMAASAVFGQPDSVSVGGGNAPNRMISPRHIAVDGDDRLYVCDTGNHRVLIWEHAPTAGGRPDPAPSFEITGTHNLTTRLRSPHGIWVNRTTGEIWVTDTVANRVLRYPQFDQLFTNPLATAAIPSSAPLALTLDGFGNLLIAEGINRVAIHYPGIALTNAANFLQRPLSPGMIASLFPTGTKFADDNHVAMALPLPTDLGDIQVLVNQQPVPLFFVGSGQINFLTPMNLPTSGEVEVEVVRKSIGQVLAAGRSTVDVASPALFTVTMNGTGQVAALNQDNSVNSASNPIARGQVIQMFGTGQGFVPGAPPDGHAPTGVTAAESRPDVFIGSRFVDPPDVQYWGLAPGLAGVWQINLRIPEFVLPGNEVLVLVRQRGIPSNNPQNPNQIRATIAVKQ